MNFPTLTKTFLIAVTLFSCAITVCTGSFILVNKSRYDIFCRDRSIEQAKENLWTHSKDSNIVLKPGERIQLPLNKRYSIRTAGPKTAMSNYYDIPTPNELAKQTLNREEEIHFSAISWEKGFIPIISVTSGLVYGWTFTLSNTWSNKQNHNDAKNKALNDAKNEDLHNSEYDTKYKNRNDQWVDVKK